MQFPQLFHQLRSVWCPIWKQRQKIILLSVFGENQEVDALHKLKQKLKSQTGASITFALLLFLVCAVVGSAVLVAGTAAAGRMSKVAEMDQRYYAVNSAARLLMDQVAGDKNTVTIIKKESKETPAGSKYYLLDNETGKEEEIDSSKGLSIAQEAAYRLARKESTATQKQLNLTVTGATDVDRLNAEIEETTDAEGGLTLLIKSKKDTKKNDGQYSLELKFNLTKSEVVDETEKQRTTTYKYTWNVRDLRVVGSQRWQDETTGS